METGVFWELGSVSDDGLRAQLTHLLASGYRTEARIIAHLAEVDERKLYLKDGSESLFAYCTLRLGLSSSEAFHRTTAARIARRFPLVFSLIEQRRLHLTAVRLLRDYLTPQNHRELLAEASGKTKLQVQELIVRSIPRTTEGSVEGANGQARASARGVRRFARTGEERRLSGLITRGRSGRRFLRVR